MSGLRAAAARPVRHEVLWPGLVALLALVLFAGLGVTTIAAPPRGARGVDLGFALAPSLAWAVASLVIGRFLAAGLIRQGVRLHPASALLIAGALVVVGAFCVLPYEFLLTDVSSLGFDVVVPLWGLGILLLLAAGVAHGLARGAGSPELDARAGGVGPLG